MAINVMKNMGTLDKESYYRTFSLNVVDRYCDFK